MMKKMCLILAGIETIICMGCVIYGTHEYRKIEKQEEEIRDLRKRMYEDAINMLRKEKENE